MVDVLSSSSNFSSSSTSSSNDNVHPPPVPEPPTSQPPQPQARQTQPLLPSQILALGSIAADVEMVLPVPTSSVMPHTTSPPPSFNTSTEIPQSHSPDSNLSYSQDLTTLISQTQNQNQPSSPRLGPSDTPVSNPPSLRASSYIRPVDPSGANFDDPATAIALRLSGLGEFADEMNGALDDVIGVDGEVISNEPDEVEAEGKRDGDGESLTEKPDSEAFSSVEDSAEDGYLSDFLESYQRGTEDGMDDEDDGFDTRSYVDDSGALADGVEVDEIEFAARSHLSYFYVSDEDDENDLDRPNGDGYYDNHDDDINTPELPVFSASESHLPSPPSSSISLSRSLSSKSYFSHCSSNSSGGMKYTNTNAHPNHSLSSLELELDGPAKSESSSMLSRSLSERERIADSSTRRSSSSYHTHSHDGTPALSRTRSSSEDSDVPLHSPNADDWTSFPYSYQPGGPAMYSMFHPTSQSALFASSLGSQQAEQRPEHERHASEIFYPEAESSFTRQTYHVGNSARNDEDDLEHAFGEYPYSQLLPGSVGAGAGFGFGFDKIMLAGEVADVNRNEGNEKEKDGRLATSTSSSIDIEVHRTTITTSSESSSLNGIPPPDTNSLVSHSRILSYVSASSQITGIYTRARTPPSTPCESAELLPLVDMDLLRASLATSQMSLDQPEDGGGGRYPSGNSGPWSATANYSYQTNSSASMGSRSVRGRGGRRNFGEEDDEDDERRPPRRATFERGSGVEDAKQSSEEDEEDGYGSPSGSPNEILRQPHQRPPTRPWVSTSTGAPGSRSTSPSAFTFPRSRPNTAPDSTVAATNTTSSSMPQTRFPVSSHSHKHYYGSSTSSSRYVSEADSDSDDDVPLAQRIPGALTMQKTIRRQFKEEKEVRRRERAHRQHEGDSERRSRQMTLRPAGAGAGHDGSAALGSSSSHDAAILAAASVSSSQPKRQRTLTLPGNSAAPPPPPTPFNPQDLARKLAHVQLAEVASSTQHAQFPPQQQILPSFQQQHLRSRSKSVSRTSSDAPRPYDPAFNYATSPTAPPLPITPSSASTTRSRSIRDPSSASSAPCHGRSPISSTTPLSPPPLPPLPSLRPQRSIRHPSPSRPSIDDPRSIPPLPNGAGSGQILRASTTSRPNRETSQIKRSVSLSRVNGPVSRESPPPVPPVNLSRTSGDEQRKVSMKVESRMVSARPSMDVERPQRNQALPAPITKNTVSQQRVFVGNLQQFNMVEIGPTTTAGDVVSMMEAGGALVGWAGSGGWMVFEIAQDFGMGMCKPFFPTCLILITFIQNVQFGPMSSLLMFKLVG